MSALSLGAILVVGCGKSSSSDQALNLESFAVQAADVWCSAMSNCSCTDASAVQDCKTAYREMITLVLSEQLAYRPSMKLDPTAAQTCLDSFQAAVSECHLPSGTSAQGTLVSRSQLPVYIPNCEEIFVGTQTESERCGDSWDCITTLACDRRTWTCAPRIAVEQSCQYVDCHAGLTCGADSICTQIPGEGEACPTYECQEGLNCVDVAGTYTCVAPHQLGADCTDGVGCAEGTYCDATCKALIADGETCGGSGQCLHGWCNSYDSKCIDPGICFANTL